MQSTSTNQGAYTLNCYFGIDTDVNIDTVNVQNRLQQAMGTLPQAVTKYGVSVQQRSPQMLMAISLYSPNQAYDSLFISNYAQINLVNPLAAVPGIGSNTLIGQREYAMRAWVDPNKLQKLGLEPTDISAAITEQNTQNPTGIIGQPPAKAGTAFQLSVSSQGQLTDSSQFGNIAVRANPDGSILRLRDVARVDLGAQNYSTIGRLDAHDATVILLYQTPTANDAQHQRLDQGRGGVAARRLHLGRARRLHLLGQHPHRDHSDDRRARFAHRHVRRVRAAGIQFEYPHALWPRSSRRHRGR
jgi:multidrug efflux pump subunit AcrB